MLRWTCPHCADSETYVSVRDADLLSFLRAALAQGERDFGIPSDASWHTRLVRGLHPECVREPDEQLYDIYVAHDADGWQARLQIGHEVFHRLCSGGCVFHWTHEMLACLFSVRLLRTLGADRYADAVCAEYAASAELLPIETMLRADLSHSVYPPGLYGRVFLMGQSLTECVGWEQVRRLTRFTNEWGQPNFAAWQASLLPDASQTVTRILGQYGAGL